MRFVLPIYLLLTSARYALAQGGCYKEWSSLATDIYSAAFDSAFTGNTYTLCKNTFFNAESLSVKIYSSNITIQCGDDGDPNNVCLINGGTYQIFVSEGLQGSPTGVQLKGLTFGPSSMINVVAYGSNIEVELDNCEFKDSTTSSAIGVYANGVGTKININESSFRNNIYLTAIGAVEGAMINVSNSIFIENTVYGSEGVVGVLGTGSSLSLSTSCFISNTIVNATSVVHAETNSFVSFEMEGNFGLNNDPVVNLEFCDGFFDTSCQTFSASYCLANPDITPSATPTSTPSTTPSGNPIATPSLSPSITASLVPTLSPSSLPTVTASEVPSLSPTKPWCYDDWDILTSDIFDVTLGAQGGSSALVYHLCPDSVMNASIRPLYLWDDDVNVICGMNGDLSDNCVISGGDYQIYVADHPDRGSPKGVTMKGITFTGQGIASIVVYGIGESQVTIDDCLFENTNNEAAVSIYIGTSTDKKNMVEIHHSQFQKNTLLSVIGNVGGTVSVVESLFNDNVVLGYEGIFGTVSYGEGSATSSCFMRNNVLKASGVVYVDDSSEFLTSSENFGAGNMMSSNICDGLHLSYYNKCSNFDHDHCVGFPELSPSMSPTRFSQNISLLQDEPIGSGSYLQSSLLPTIIPMLIGILYF